MKNTININRYYQTNKTTNNTTVKLQLLVSSKHPSITTLLLPKLQIAEPQETLICCCSILGPLHHLLLIFYPSMGRRHAIYS